LSSCAANEAIAPAAATPPATVSTAAPTASGRQYTPPYYVFSPDLPHDMITHDVGAIGFQPFVDILAWDAFIAVNWPAPATITERGVPDRQNVIGGFKTSGGEGGHGSVMPTGPVVWETFKSTEDIYLDPPVAPPPFDAPPIVPAACQQLASQNPKAAQRILTSTLQAFTNYPLIDQNGQKVWYEQRVNRAYYDYVVKNGFYDSRNQQGKTISFPSSSDTTSQSPVIRVKAAWKILGLLGSKHPDDLTKFYTGDALLFDKNANTCSVAKVGLVGLHVVQKTAQLPQWSWATFEQRNNAPDQKTGPVQGTIYNFYDPTCPPSTCPVNKPPAAGASTPTQVMRVVPVDSTAPNATYQAALQTLRADNVWQNYMLVNAQWGATTTPGQPNQPAYLANTTMETYLQDPVDDPSSPHGCINCHGKFAATKNTDFQLFKAYPQQDESTKALLKRFMR
jgi:hypothetical protein